MFTTWLEGKKTILAGLIITVLSGLTALGVKLPFGEVTEAAVLTGLGVLVVIFRFVAKKNLT